MLIEVNGIELNIELRGLASIQELENAKTPVVVAIPGGPGFSHTLICPGLDPISDQFPLVYIDPRGTGRSSGREQETWTLEQHARDIIALVEELKIQKPVLYGYSAGAHYAAKALALAPDLFHAFIMCSPVSLKKEILFERLIALGGDVAKRLMIDLDPTGFEDYMIQVMPLYDTVQRTPEQAATLDANIEQFLSTFHPMLDQLIWKLLEECTNKTGLFLTGLHDPLYRPEDCMQGVQKHIGAKWRVLQFEESGHDILLSEPQRLTKEVAVFLNALQEAVAA